MLSNNPIIILEDDIDEQELLAEAFSNLQTTNPVKFFRDGESFLEYLANTPENPLLILSAINIHKLDGLQVRGRIQANEYLKSKGIPFIFFTLKDDNNVVKMAYDLTVQGYFIKGDTMQEVEKQLSLVIDYWKQCRHPNNPT